MSSALASKANSEQPDLITSLLVGEESMIPPASLVTTPAQTAAFHERSVSNPYAVLENTAEEPGFVINIRPSTLTRALKPT